MKYAAINIIILTCIILYGGFLRLYNLSEQPYWMDEGYTITAIIGTNTDYNCPIYCYTTKHIAKILGNDAFSYRLFAVFMGITFIILIYLVTKKLFTPPHALVVATITSLSYWHIAWSRQARWYTLFLIFFWLALFLFYKTTEIKPSKQKVLYGLGTLISTLLAIYTHQISYILILIYLLYALYHKKYKIFSLITLMGAVLLIFYTIPVSLNYVLPYYTNFLIKEYWLFIILSIYGILTVPEQYKKQIHLLCLSAITLLVSLGFFNNIVNYRYLLVITPALYILATVGLLHIIHSVRNLYVKICIGILFGIGFFISHGIIFPQENYFLESDTQTASRPYYAYTPQPDWNTAYDFIRTHKKPTDIIISSAPQFNSLFFGESGYWLNFDLWGNPKNIPAEDRYVRAISIPTLENFIDITSKSHGYVMYDYMAQDGRISPDILSYIETNLEKVFFKFTNPYSQIWIYRF